MRHGGKTPAQIEREIDQLVAGAPAPVPRRPGVPRAEYRAIGADGDPWPAWIAVLKSSPGIYVIRDAATRRPLYAGSAQRNLYATITRHFQRWGRAKRFWKGQFGAGHDPGLVYDRAACEVAFWITTEDQRLQRESDLIARLRPRDNMVEHPDGEDGDEPQLEEAPF